MDNKSAQQFVIDSLRELLESEPRSSGEVAAWYEKAKELKAFLQRDDGLHKVPHVFWHYLEDADIRFKDPRYAQAQISGVEDSMRVWIDSTLAG